MISPLAYIHPNAKLGNNVIIDPFAVIQDGVTIGDGTHVMSHATVMSYTTLGKNCRVFPGAVLGAVPQDLKFVGEEATVEIGDNSTFRECVTVNRGTKDKMKTVVGSNCLLMAYTHVAHDCILGNNVILANSVQLAGHVEVGDFAIIGGMTGAQQFTRIGAHTYIGGQSVIRKDVPPFVKAAREPMVYMGLNIVGLQRRNFSPEVIESIQKIYHLLFVANSNTTSAVKQIREQIADNEAKESILQFIESSRAGIIRRYSKNGQDEDQAF